MDQSQALTTTTPGGVFGGIQAFEDGQRIAKALASSSLVPSQFQGQHAGSSSAQGTLENYLLGALGDPVP